MVNLVEALKPLLQGLVKLAGLRQTTVELEPGTVMSFWVPKAYQMINDDKEPKKTKKKKKKKDKPAVVLMHGFAAEGIMTWLFQARALAKKHDVFVPDLLYFGGSKSSSSERSLEFQARCFVAALARLGVARCAVVGFSYGGMVAFKMAEMWPELVSHLVVSGSVIAMTDSVTRAMMQRIGYASPAEFLLPDSVEGLKALFSVATYEKFPFPDCFYRDYLQVMFENKKERRELLEGMVMKDNDAVIPVFPQRILLLWGENENIFNIELAKNMTEQLGEKATLQSIKKAGHLVHLERPCVYNRHLKEFLAQMITDDAVNK